MKGKEAKERVAEVVPLKQGLKRNGGIGKPIIAAFVAEVVPLKQGLKLYNTTVDGMYLDGCRGSSIKTRIETDSSDDSSYQARVVAEVVPLKQGLKHYKQIILNDLRHLLQR